MIDDKDIIRRAANGNDPYADENLDEYGILATLNKMFDFWASHKRRKKSGSLTETALGCMLTIITVGFAILGVIVIGGAIYFVFMK